MKANFSGANLSQAILRKAKFEKTNLFKANLNQTILIGVRGLTEDLLAMYKAMGAITNDPVIDKQQ